MLADAAAPDGRAQRRRSASTRRTRTSSRSSVTLNLFLHEVHENRALRDDARIIQQHRDDLHEHAPPLRVDCTYLVTAWSPDTGRR